MVTWTHDVGPGEDELDGALVHPLGGEQEGELVEEPQGGDPGLVVMSANECRVNRSINKWVESRGAVPNRQCNAIPMHQLNEYKPH